MKKPTAANRAEEPMVHTAKMHDGGTKKPTTILCKNNMSHIYHERSTMAGNEES
jgi:hypothetical protein